MAFAAEQCKSASLFRRVHSSYDVVSRMIPFVIALILFAAGQFLFAAERRFCQQDDSFCHCLDSFVSRAM
jgi:hypothetical protein